MERAPGRKGSRMVKDQMNYNEMVESALRGVVRLTLDRIAENGLPGNHHLYISFHTEYPGVVLPGHLRERYPEEMTVVLQHQFWGLETNDQGFEVTLSFDDVHEYIFVPFAAMTAFADPSVQFGLQFKSGEEARPTADGESSRSPNPAVENAGEGEIVALDSFRKK